MPPEVVHVHIIVHRHTGLVLGTTDDIPGFVVHANDEDEMEAKLAPALNSFMRALGHDVTYAEVERNEPAPGFGPSEFIARRSLAEAA